MYSRKHVTICTAITERCFLWLSHALHRGPTDLITAPSKTDTCKDSKRKIVPMRVLKVCVGSDSSAPFILNLEIEKR